MAEKPLKYAGRLAAIADAPGSDYPNTAELKESTLHQKAMETLSYLELAHQEAALLEEILFGGTEALDKPPCPESAEGILARCSELATMLTGRISGLNRRTGSRPPVATIGRAGRS